MARTKEFAVAGIVLIVLLIILIGGVQLWLWNSPLVVVGRDKPAGEIFDRQTAVGRVFAEVQECGEQQKGLYQYIVAYKDKHGRLPKDTDELTNDVQGAMAFDSCPAGLTTYVVHFENFGNPRAVLIEERQNKHRTALKLWLRGIKPRVQTMGDGTIRLFEGGKIATIQAKK